MNSAPQKLAVAAGITLMLLGIPTAYAYEKLPTPIAGEIIPGMGACTKKEHNILDRASLEKAEIMFPESNDRKHAQRVKAYERRMQKPGIFEGLLFLYMKCGRTSSEFFPPEEIENIKAGRSLSAPEKKDEE